MRTLKTHQIYASSLMDVMPSLALFYEAGTGKTMCVLDWIYRSMQKNGHGSYLILGPKASCSVWRKAIDELSLFEGYTDQGIDIVRSQCTIASFGSLGRRINEGTEDCPKRTIKVKEEYEHPWDAIIIDESQGLGGHSSVQTQICLRLQKWTSRRYILSGTPISGGGGKADWQKIYGQIRFLDPGIWRNWTHFCALQVLAKNQFHRPIMYNEAYCRGLMDKYAIVCRLADCVEMPESVVTDVPVKMAERKIAKDFSQMNTEKYGITIEVGGTMYVKMLELASGHYIDDNGVAHFVRTEKDEALGTILDGTDDKVVIFARFTESVKSIQQICAQRGKTIVYDGNAKADAWLGFQNGDQRYIICQYQRGQASIDLYASHTSVFYEPCLSSLTLEQCTARTRRTGQTQRCLYYWIVTDDCVERKVVDTVRAGMDVTREMLDTWSKEGICAYERFPKNFTFLRVGQIGSFFSFII